MNHEIKIVQPKNDVKKSLSFLQAVGPCLTYGQVEMSENSIVAKLINDFQLYGMIPVDGVLSGDENQLEFRWKSLKTIYTMFFLFCGAVESCLGTRRLLRLGFKLQYVEGLVFFILAAIRAFIFFRLARNWKEIMKMWQKCENVFLYEPYRVKGFSLKVKIRVVFAVLAALAVGNRLKFQE